jgi:hypothetical protein
LGSCCSYSAYSQTLKAFCRYRVRVEALHYFFGILVETALCTCAITNWHFGMFVLVSSLLSAPVNTIVPSAHAKDYLKDKFLAVEFLGQLIIMIVNICMAFNTIWGLLQVPYNN